MSNFNYTIAAEMIKDNLKIELSLQEIKKIISKNNDKKYKVENYNDFVDLFIESFYKLSLEEKSKIIEKNLKKEKEYFLKEQMNICFLLIENESYEEQKKGILNKIKVLDTVKVPSFEKIKNILNEYNLKDYYNLFFIEKLIFDFYEADIL